MWTQVQCLADKDVCIVPEKYIVESEWMNELSLGYCIEMAIVPTTAPLL